MNTDLPVVVITSPKHSHLGSESGPDKTLLMVLVGNKIDERVADKKGPVDIKALMRECADLNATAIFFRRTEGGWIPVSPREHGTEPYFVSPVMSANFFNLVHGCEDDQEQDRYLRAIGLAINGAFVGC